ncbi:MAG TPA: DUF1778 domain-containing protein [Candidatus Thiothrix moscowensis]|uniref:type II toxin-antitoxin system TacA family antitoxin n=1 Tax=unclassified Thiothrix TaxID=2636184 RepID=UPI0025F5E558|nr:MULTISPECIES: DUF1778 domain-containing protein [unclassified Thiothrix]HRJ52160.1 DUF1778 domain-containing protein [Candidatus Thiothrix moscowensis]HRJ92329.1 DUF1778 domain-containing protein [Candidatus Thiothrix moscowensis]
MNATLPRITARVDLDVQTLLSQAAAIVGISSINAFVLNAAIEKAKLIIEKEQTLKLSQRDATLLAQALDSPAKTHPRLQQAAQRYREQSAV